VSRQEYKAFNFKADTLHIIAVVNRMIENYAAQGFTLSVRQIYYQLVARHGLENTERSYKRIASILNDARLAGYLDWDAIEDRGRDIVMMTRWESGSSIIDACAHGYHMDMWDSQDHRVFVIVEKAALAGVLEGVCRKYDVPLLAARGYPSVSIVREIAVDHIIPALRNGQYVTVLHMGDHDPSGIDMTRDLRERFNMFIKPDVDDFDAENFTLERIALEMSQIEELRPPPNPAKTTDSRFRDYRRKFGDESWELDALEPSYIVDLVESNIENFIDDDRWATRKAEVEEVRDVLKETAVHFKMSDTHD
jgi:hypothetical protein